MQAGHRSRVAIEMAVPVRRPPLPAFLTVLWGRSKVAGRITADDEGYRP